MKLRIKSKSARYTLIAYAAATLLPPTGYAKSKPILTTDILQHLSKESWDRGVFAANSMVDFLQETTTTPGGTNATRISKITLRYFISNNCTATNGTSVPTYTTPDGTSFTISTLSPFTPKPFHMVAASAWNVGNSKVSPTISTTYSGKSITDILSIAVTFQFTNSNTPQSNFTGKSFACVPVTCTAGPSGQCTSTSGTQSFQLKTTAVIGDPADGGVIACMNGGLNNLVTPKADNSTGIVWGSPTQTTATSTTDGATNTTTIVTTFGSGSNYAARTCSTYSAAGGFTSNWFLPAGNNATTTGQLNCLYTNSNLIGGFNNSSPYWSSTDFNNAISAYNQGFSNGGQGTFSKTSNLRRVRCSRTFTP